MTSLAKKHDESKPSARFVVLMGLLFTGEDAGLLSIEALRAKLARGPLHDVDRRHGEVADVGGRKRRSDADGGRGDQAVRLVQRHASLGELPAPASGHHSLRLPQRSKTKAPE